jgi:hypothetical protein
MYLPILLHVDRAVVVVIRGRAVVRLIAASIVARLLHLAVVGPCRSGLPRCNSVVGAILCRIRSWCTD